MKVVIYDSLSGEIAQVTTVPVGLAHLQHRVGQSFLLETDDADIDDRTHYVDVVEQAVVDKTPFTLTLTPADPLVDQPVSGTLPGPGWVTVDALGDDAIQRTFDDDGALTLEFAAPGQYRITIDMPYHICEEVILNVAQD